MSCLKTTCGERSPNMQCPEASELLSLRLDRRLSSDEERCLQAHLASCEACREEWQALQQVHRLFGQARMVAPPPLMKERIMARIRRRDDRLAAWRRGLLFFLGLVIVLILSSSLFFGLSAIVINAPDSSSLISTLAEAATRIVAITATVFQALATCLRALLASANWLIVVGYLAMAGALLMGWTRLVTRPYRGSVEQQGL